MQEVGAPQPLFVSFEGIDGCGKTTQLALLAEKLRSTGREVVATVEPGGTEVGRAIRALLLDPRYSLEPRTELLLFFSSRAQNAAELIQPALKRHAAVLCDRFTDSTVVYQGAGRGIDSSEIYDLHRIACRGLLPDLTFLLDIDVTSGLARARLRTSTAESSETRMEQEDPLFFERVRAGYLALAKREPGRIRVIDARGGTEKIAAAIWEEVRSRV